MRLGILLPLLVPVALGACAGHDSGQQQPSSEATGRSSPVERSTAVRSAPASMPAFSVEAGPNGALAVRFASAARLRPSALLELPGRADGPTRVLDRASGMALRFRIRGAGSAAANPVDAEVRYAGGGPYGSHVVQKPRLNGTEDFVEFDRRPASEEVTYLVDVSSAAGLRLVGNVLELVDATGTPRLRMGAPYVVDRTGTRHDARVALADCAADRDPRGPWGRPVTPAGRGECAVKISWGGSVLYPAVLDPTWTNTANKMSSVRRAHTATMLSTGKVLVVGGDYPTGASTVGYVASADLFDPATNTFSPTGSLTTARSHHAAALLTNGNVLVTGGEGSAGILGSTEIYDAGTGQFGAGGALLEPRKDPEIVVQASNNVPLVTGGLGSSSLVLDTSEKYDTTNNVWTGAATMPYRRMGHFMTVLSTGQTMVIGGITTTSTGDLATCETLSPGGSVWQPTTNAMQEARYYFAGAKLSSGKVLVASGYSRGISANTYSTEIFDTTTGQWTSAGSLSQARMHHTLTALPNGSAMLAGGVVMQEATTITQYLRSAELYDPSLNYWTPLPDMLESRFMHTATLLGGSTQTFDDDRVLITGGDTPLGATDTAEIFALDVNGAPCTTATTCKSGFCVDGVCCESDCTTACFACDGTSTGAAAGTCTPVLAGQDPHDDCTDDGSPSCTQDGLCNGTGSCRQYSSPFSCTPNPCTSGSQCASGYCVDGICCDSSCSGTCQACTAAKKGSGVDGQCDYVQYGSDPDSECGTMGTGVCAGDATCDGSGSCRVAAEGTTCAQAACTDSVTLSSAAQCSAAGDCIPSTTLCDPYRCDPAALSCKYSCSSDTDCAPGGHCVGSTCQKAANGSPCTTSSDCSSGMCADGFCCDDYCSGLCEACNLPGSEGTCTAVTGSPRGTRSPCSGTGACRGTCNGIYRSDCTYPGAEVACGTSSNCTNGVAEGDLCNGFGQCVSGASQSCAPYGCDGDACGTTCASDTGCADGYKCDANGECVNGNIPLCGENETVVSPGGSTQSCRPFKCVNGACLGSCTTNDDCMKGARCLTRTSKCVANSDDGGCGCRAVGSRTLGGGRLALSLFGIGIALSRFSGSRKRRTRALNRGQGERR